VILEIVKRIILENKICNNCLGRQFALLITGGGISNFEKGFSLKMLILMEAHQNILNDMEDKDKNINLIKMIAKNGLYSPALMTLKKLGEEIEITGKCSICEGILERIPFYIQMAKEKLSTIEYNNFLIGSKFHSRIIENEDRLRAKYGLKWGETIKGEFNREVGKGLLKLLNGKNVEFNNPEIVLVIDTNKNKIELDINPLFIYGRYLKLIRGIPQTHWTCKNCNGRGCSECDFKGYRYETSVEELIIKRAIEMCKGTGAKFHGAGREDIDALMLGSGRPFIMEIKDPKIRSIDLKKLEQEINTYAKDKVMVKELEFSDKNKVRKIKAGSQLTKKIYRTKVELKTKVDPNKIFELEKIFSNIIIEQKTPNRVLHRRSNKTRKKMVYSFKIEEITEYGFIAVISTQGGTYIKELISGDMGRTHPSVSEVLDDIECNVIELDVIIVDNI